MFKIQNSKLINIATVFIFVTLLFTPSVALGADLNIGNIGINSSLSDTFSGGLLGGSALSAKGSELKSKYDILSSTLAIETDTTKKAYIATQMSMIYRQMDVIDSQGNIKDRIDALGKDDTRRDGVKVENAKATLAVTAFAALDATESDGASGYKYISSDTFKSEPAFNKAEKTAIKAINDVNMYLLAPTRPGTSKKGNKTVGGVPQGDLIEDFIPGVIRILFRFASLAVLISFVVSGVMFVMVFGEEERVTKARHMLYYSLIGFAFVSLAFAIVKAVTDIDFFGFI